MRGYVSGARGAARVSTWTALCFWCPSGLDAEGMGFLAVMGRELPKGFRLCIVMGGSGAECRVGWAEIWARRVGHVLAVLCCAGRNRTGANGLGSALGWVGLI